MSLLEQISDDAMFSFLLELTRQQLDAKTLHEMALGQSRSLQAEMRAFALKQKGFNNEQKPLELSPSLGMKTPSPKSFSCPADRSVSKDSYSPDTEKKLSNDTQMMPYDANTKRPLVEELDYSKMAKRTHNEMLTNAKRSEFISLRAPFALKSEPMEQEQEEVQTVFTLTGPIIFPPKFYTWIGSSIYANIPERIIPEFDKMLRDRHTLKIKCVKILNEERPVCYDYNPKKSRTRVSYIDPQDADDRTRNNIASRRSRQRKKYQLQIQEYAVDFDNDDYILDEKHIAWLNTIINNVQLRMVSDKDSAIEDIENIRQRCGLT